MFVTVSGPAFRNSLPPILHGPSLLPGEFRRELITLVFRLAYGSALLWPLRP